MRQIKFRVWNIQDKCWDNPSILEVWNDSGKLEPYSFVKTGKLNPLYIPIENYVIQQFTGLLDKNGKEIYEGDIVTHQHYLSEEDKYTVIRWTREEEDFHPGFVIRDKFTQGGLCEVVGNIFENPELLEKSK